MVPVGHIQRRPRQRVVMNLLRRTSILEHQRHRIRVVQQGRHTPRRCDTLCRRWHRRRRGSRLSIPRGLLNIVLPAAIIYISAPAPIAVPVPIPPITIPAITIPATSRTTIPAATIASPIIKPIVIRKTYLPRIEKYIICPTITQPTITQPTIAQSPIAQPTAIHVRPPPIAIPPIPISALASTTVSTAMIKIRSRSPSPGSPRYSTPRPRNKSAATLPTLPKPAALVPIAWEPTSRPHRAAPIMSGSPRTTHPMSRIPTMKSRSACTMSAPTHTAHARSLRTSRPAENQPHQRNCEELPHSNTLRLIALSRHLPYCHVEIPCISAQSHVN